jgi:hypothetical protein
MKEPAKEITSIEKLKAKEGQSFSEHLEDILYFRAIPIDLTERIIFFHEKGRDEIVKAAISLKEREVIKAAIEKTGKALLEMEIDWYDHMSKSQDPDYCHGRVNAYIDAQVIVKQVLNSMLNPATNGEDKGE